MMIAMSADSFKLFDAIRNRHCKRAFFDKPVADDALSDVLEMAGHAPSSKNTQPWKASIVTGAATSRLAALLCEKFDRELFDSPDYVYTPEPMSDVFLGRARECGYALFKLKGIDRHDHAARRAHERKNYEFFGAPVVMFFHLPRESERGNFLDMGFFIQNVMLGLVGSDLGSCPQFSLTRFSDTIREFLGLESDRLIVCALSVGYPDSDALINTFIPNRLSVDAYTDWKRA